MKKLQRLISMVLVLGVLLSVVAPSAAAAGVTGTDSHPFKDVKESAWYHEYVSYVWEHSIFNGVTNTKFDPDGYMTRAMFVTVLGRIAGADISKYTKAVFDDVNPAAWYGPYVAWAAENKVTMGMGNNKFAPDDYVTREQIATFLHRFMEEWEYTLKRSTLTYKDNENISDWAEDAVSVCLGMGLMEGDTNGKFRPRDNTNRAEAAAICTRLHKIMSGKPDSDDGPVNTVNFHSVKIGYPASMSEEDKAATTFPEEQMVLSGELVYALPTPYREGYIFAGWYYDSALAVVADVDDVITENMTVYPRLVPEEEAPVLGDGAMNYVAAIDVEHSYRVTVQAPSAAAVKEGISFIGVSDGNVAMPFSIVDNGNGTYTINPEDGLDGGKTYQIIANDRETLATPENPFPTDDEYVLFIHEGEVQRKDIRYYNIFTYREEEENLRIDDDVKFVDFGLVSGFGMDEAAGLYSVRMSESGEFSLIDNETSGTFVYEGTPALEVGDIVAIHRGDVDVESRTMDDETEVAYIEITKVEGTTYHYVSANATDVVFLPDVIPVPSYADTDGDPDNGSVTIDAGLLDFTYFEKQEALNSDTVVGVDDYIVFYEGELAEGTQGTYAIITGIEYGDDTVTITYSSVTVEELQAAIDTYTVNGITMNLPESEVVMLENKLVQQAEESGFAEEAAAYAVQNRLGIEEEIVWGETYTMSRSAAQEFGIDVDAGNIMIQLEVGRPNVKANITTKLQKVTQVNEATGVRVDFGVTVPVGIEMVENITGKVMESLTLDLYVTFEQEVAFNTKFSVDVQWDNWLFVYWIDEVVVDAKFEMGTYTGFGAIFTMSTEKYYDKTYLWNELVEKEDGTDIMSSASSIAKKLNEALTKGDLSFFGGEDGTAGSLVEKYEEMLKREIDYFDILFLPLLHRKGYMDPKTHIVNYILDIELVLAAKLNVTMGISFENLNVKEYTFHFRLFDGEGSAYVVDKQTPYTNFNFFVMGNLGLRTGLSVTFTVGLISTKLDNVGIHVEVGPYLELYGFYYYHFDKVGKAKPNIKSSGAVHLEIGIYMALDIFTGVFMDLLSVEVHLVDESWPIWDTDSMWYPIEPEIPESTVTQYNGDSIGISNQYVNVREFNIVTGEWRVSQRKLSDYVITPSPSTYARSGSGDTDKITYNAKTQKFEVHPDKTDTELSADFEFVLKDSNELLGDVKKTIHINWIKTHYAVEYYSGSTTYNPETGSYDIPVVDESKTLIFTAGDTLEGVPNHQMSWPGYDFKGWQIVCPSLPDIHGKMLDEVNGLKGYTMPKTNIGLKQIHERKTDTPYTVRHWADSLTQFGEYDLIAEEVKTGTTMAYITKFDFLTDPGLELDYSKYPYERILPFTDQNGKENVLVVYHSIMGDGSTVVDIYYNRKSAQVGVHANNPILTDAYPELSAHSVYTLKYGEEIPDPGFEDYSGEEFTFLGWSTTPNGDVEYEVLPTVSSDYRQNYYAVWDYPTVEFDVNYYIYDPYIKGYPETPAYTETKELPLASRISMSALAAADASALEPHWAHDWDGYYVDDPGRAYTDDYLNLDSVLYGVTFNVYCTASYEQLFFSAKMEYAISGSTITLPEGPEKAGYDFIGWRSSYVSDQDKLYEAGSELTVTRSDYFYAEYEVSSDTPYTVNHYYEKVDAGEYEEPVTQTFTGTTGSDVSPETVEKTGYTSPAVRTVTVEADGSTVVNYYYNRTSYDISIDKGDHKLSGQYTSSYRYGVVFYLTEDGLYINRPGYTLIGFYCSEHPETVLNEDNYYLVSCDCLTSQKDLVFLPKWEENDITYHVEHYLEQLDGSYKLQQTDKPTAVINETVTASEADFTGFTFDETIEGTVLDGTIVSDSETLVLKLYYTRNSYTATWLDYDGTTELDRAEFKYGETVELPETVGTPSREGYTFDGWKTFGTMPAKSVSFSAAEYGMWTAITGPYDLVFDFNGESMKKVEENKVVTYETEDVTELVDSGEMLADYIIAAESTEFMSQTYPGYTFAGWYDADGKPYDANTTEVMPSGNLTLTAKWTPIEFTIIYEPGVNWFGEVVADQTQLEYSYSYGDVIEAPDVNFAIKDSSTVKILGWMLSSTSGMTQGDFVAFNSWPIELVYGNYNEWFTAEMFTEDSYVLYMVPFWGTDYTTVEFNSNGGLGTMNSQCFYRHGGGGELSRNLFTREGYTFVGWNTAMDGTGESYADMDIFSPIGGSGVHSVMLYAQWEKVE